MKSPRHIVQLSLSTDKKYPSYWNMQSAVSYIDGYSELWGTPGLRHSKNYNTSLSYIFRQKYVFTLYYNRSNDYFNQAAYQATGRLALVYQELNWNYSQMAGAQVVLPINVVKWYTAKVTLTGFQMHQCADHYHDISFDKKKWVGLVLLDNSFRAGKRLMFNLDGFWQSPSIQGIYDLKSVVRLSASAKWMFAGDKASVSLKCNDIFNAGNPLALVRQGLQHLDLGTNKYSRSVSGHFSYRFGGHKKKDVREVDSSRFGH